MYIYTYTFSIHAEAAVNASAAFSTLSWGECGDAFKDLMEEPDEKPTAKKTKKKKEKKSEVKKGHQKKSHHKKTDATSQHEPKHAKKEVSLPPKKARYLDIT